MIFQSPGRLWLLALIPLLVLAYLIVQRQRRRYTVRFTNLALLTQVAPRRPGWRRHVAAGLFLTTIITMMVGFARPATGVKVPRDRATIIVTIDVSLSMQATDVTPSRFEAARLRAKEFISDLPERFNVGVVAFSGSANVIAPPSTDRQTAIASLDQLTMDKRTAIGEAVHSSLQAIRTFDTEARDNPPPAHIVLLSDGDNTSGRSVGEAIQESLTAKVPVSTIAFGTPNGSVEIDGEVTPVQVNKQTLQTLADGTKGNAYEALDSGQLSEVYANIGESIGTRIEHREVSAYFIGIALFLALAAGGASLLWFARLP